MANEIDDVIFNIIRCDAFHAVEDFLEARYIFSFLAVIDNIHSTQNQLNADCSLALPPKPWLRRYTHFCRTCVL